MAKLTPTYEDFQMEKKIVYFHYCKGDTSALIGGLKLYLLHFWNGLRAFPVSGVIAEVIA